jgi:hypothetical protein
MMKNNIKNVKGNIALGLGTLFFTSCSGYGTIVKMQEVNKVPSGQYERIVKLNNPDGAPNKTLAGLVFIRKGASVCTDYPREETIKTIDELSMMETYFYRYFSNYEIKEKGKTFGFVSIPIDYRIILWKNETDENCKFKVQIISINKERNNIGAEVTKSGFGGGHAP